MTLDAGRINFGGNDFRLLFRLPPLSVLGQTNSADECGGEAVKILSDFVDAFNHHDAHVWPRAFAEDGDFTNVSGLTRHGRKEIEERFTGLFAGPLKSAHRTFNVRHIRFILVLMWWPRMPITI